MEHTGLTVTAWTDLLNRSGLSEDGSGISVQWAEESVRVAAEHCYRLPPNHEIGQAYLDANLPVLRQQLFRGGDRLAALLNAILERAAHGLRAKPANHRQMERATAGAASLTSTPRPRTAGVRRSPTPTNPPGRIPRST
jgi:hypothetical protein